MRMHHDLPPQDEPAKNSQCYRVLRAHVGEALRRYGEFKRSASKKASGLAGDVGALPPGRGVPHTA